MLGEHKNLLPGVRGVQRQLYHLQSNWQGCRSQDAQRSPGEDKDVRGPLRRCIKSLSFLSVSVMIPAVCCRLWVVMVTKGGKAWEARWECKLEKNSVLTSLPVRYV